MENLVIFLAKYLVIFVVLGLIVVFLRVSLKAKKEMILLTIGAGILAFILARLASKLYFDPRPFVTKGIEPLVAHSADNGFPSDHALFTMTLTSIAYFYNQKIALAMCVLTFLVGLGRVLAQVHSAVDVLGAWLIAMLATFVVHSIIKLVTKRYSHKNTTS